MGRLFEELIAIPVMVIHDHFGELRKKDGREERFTEGLPAAGRRTSRTRGIASGEEISRPLPGRLPRGRGRTAGTSDSSAK